MTCRSLAVLALVLHAGAAHADDAAPGPPTSDPRGAAHADDARDRPAARDPASTRDRTGAPDPADALDRRLAARLVRLAEHHYRAGAYYRAISAYEELAVFATDDATRLRAAVRIAMSYHHGHQLDDALAGYRAALVLAATPGAGADVAQALRIQLALARVERGLEQPGSEALEVIAAELAPSAATGPYRALALAQLARIAGLAGRPGPARDALHQLHAACLAPAPGCDLEPLLARALEGRGAPPAPQRAPWLGVALSLVVPGAGSVYGGHVADGVYYFALTTLSGLGALDVHDRGRAWSDQKAAFYGLATLAAVFYAGSALQGYVAVARHNVVAELDARRALWTATDTPLPLEAFAPAAPRDGDGSPSPSPPPAPAAPPARAPQHR